LGNAGELAEHLLVFGVSLDEAEENLRRNISSLSWPVPRSCG
jgi:hypothetical protein